MPRLKSWESPRREGRNDKGKGGGKKKKQWLKRQQMLRNKLKQNNQNNQQGRNKNSPFFHVSLRITQLKLTGFFNSKNFKFIATYFQNY